MLRFLKQKTPTHASTSLTERARLLAVGEWSSGLWIQALSSPNIGTLLYDTIFHLATCHRLRAPLFLRIFVNVEKLLTVTGRISISTCQHYRNYQLCSCYRRRSSCT